MIVPFLDAPPMHGRAHQDNPSTDHMFRVEAGTKGAPPCCLGSETEEADMPAKSKAQQKAAGAALAAKRGDIKKGELKGASKSMEKSMSEKELDKMASTKRKGKPEHASHH
jgi:hypothetical protein